MESFWQHPGGGCREKWKAIFLFMYQLGGSYFLEHLTRLKDWCCFRRRRLKAGEEKKCLCLKGTNTNVIWYMYCTGSEYMWKAVVAHKLVGKQNRYIQFKTSTQTFCRSPLSGKSCSCLFLHKLPPR